MASSNDNISLKALGTVFAIAVPIVAGIVWLVQSQARAETDINYIKADVTEVKADVKRMSAVISAHYGAPASIGEVPPAPPDAVAIRNLP